MTPADPKRCSTLTASVRSVYPVSWSERKFWKTYYLYADKKIFTSTRQLVTYLSALVMKNKHPLKYALQLDPDSIRLRSCIRLLFKYNIHFQRLLKNE
jgi:hypothetical protein